MIEKTDLKNLRPSDLEGIISAFGKERYRTNQILKWLYQQGALSFDEMTNLSKPFRQALGQVGFISSLKPLHVEESRDGTKKFLFQLEDGHRIESVLIPDRKRLTLCISTQAGCAMRCRFCLTGRMGLKRNLTTAEMVNQILAVKRTLPEKTSLTNIVLMGMGEPLDNYENTLKAIELMTHPDAFNFSSRRVTLSTVGLLPELERLSRELLRFRLAISLNAADEVTRSRLMPVNRRHPMKEILKLCRSFPLPPRARITFEYVLIRGENDSPDDAKRLAKLLRRIPSKINLIPLNEAPGIPFKKPPEETVRQFQDVLLQAGLTAIIRKSKGADISAACGQLQGRIEGIADRPEPPPDSA